MQEVTTASASIEWSPDDVLGDDEGGPPARPCRRLEQKRAARLERYARHERARRGRTRTGGRIPFQGVVVSRRDVMRHRYLGERGLAHSPRVASVLLPRRTEHAAPSLAAVFAALALD